jgi:dTDP-4-dehydrorhamnose 3,5-epimerase
VKIIKTPIKDLVLIEPQIFGDERGFLMEFFNQSEFSDSIGKKVNFVQDIHSRSSKNVLRGLHYQIKHPQGKLVRTVSGSVFDVTVDLRKSSQTFGQWFGVELSETNKRMLWVPEGFAHGFLVLSEQADFFYKTTDYYAPEYERCISWNDPELNIKWGNTDSLVLSEKDKKGVAWKDAEVFE